MTTLPKTCVTFVVVILTLAVPECDDSKVVNRGPVDHSNGVIDGEWALVRYCGGFTGECHYPAYSGEINDRDHSQSVWLASSTELVIADPCCDRFTYASEPY
ncbi:MAG: hypothetical protein WBP29_08365 [Candidatus Zixiibacteriota bacterium]